MKTIIVSRCLTGERCLYHGGKATFALPRLQALAKTHTIVAFCPEMLGGLPCPRAPIRCRDGRAYQGNRDVTPLLEQGAECACAAIANWDNVLCAILLEGSPSCDPERGVWGRSLAERGICRIAARRDNGWEHKLDVIIGRIPAPIVFDITHQPTLL